MEIQYHGANCLRISTKKSTIIVDPKSDIAELSPVTKKANAILITQEGYSPSDTGEAFVVNGPGEYEFEDYSVMGLAAQAHTESTGDKSATIYRVTAADTTVLVIGNIDSKLTEEQLEQIGMVDILVVPVGGGGYTLDAVEAASVARSIEPKVIIPVHNADDGLKYQVPQQPSEAFIKEMGSPVTEEVFEKYKVKSLPEQQSIQILKRS